MKKLLKDIIIAIIALAIICAVFWRINWISNWKEVAFLYFLLALLGFVVTTTSCRVEYGCPPIEYQPDVEQEEVDKSPEEGSSNPVVE